MKQEGSEVQKQLSYVLDFQYLTGNWQTMDEIDEGVFSYPDDDFIDRHWEAKIAPLKPENLNKQLAWTDFSFEFGSGGWSLLKKGKLVATGQNLNYFLHDEKHLIACEWDSRIVPVCWIDGEWKEVYTLDAFPKMFNGEVYALISSWESEHSLFQGDRLLYPFKAFFAWDQPLLALEVNAEGWWILYRTMLNEAPWVVYHLIHNGENLSQKAWRTDVFELRSIQGQLFYFYQKEGKIWYHFWGQDYETEFEEIVHDGCCSAGLYSLAFRDDFFTLYAKKNGKFGFYRVDIK